MLLALVFLAGPPNALAAQERQLFIEDFDSEIVVQPDGSYQVTETLRIRFEGSWNGLERELFFDHETAEGRRTRFQLELGEITDDAGTPLQVDESGIRRGIGLRIWVPGASDAVRTVVIRYTVRNGLRHFGELPPVDDEGTRPSVDPDEVWDELYYDVTGHGWRVPIEASRARVRLPEGLEVTGAWGYTGADGSTEQAVEITGSGREVEIESTRTFAPGEGLTVSVTWPAGVIPRTTGISAARDTLVMRWPYGLPLVALVAMLGLWMTRGRDPFRGSVMVEYHPPEGLSPAEVGTLIDHKAEMHDISATLVDLAVRGYIRIEETESESGLAIFGASGRKEYIFHQRKPISEWKELLPHERAYLEGLMEPALEEKKGMSGIGELFEYMRDSFGAWREARSEGESFDAHGYRSDWLAARQEPEGPVKGEDEMVQVKLSELRNRFYTHIGTVQTKIYKELKRRGFYVNRPDHVTARWGFLGFLVIFFGFFFTITAIEPPFLLQWYPEPLPTGVGFGLSAVIVLLVGSQMGVRTYEGSRARAHIQGFKEFLERVESDYYERIVTSPELFEKYLPYAMALQVESRWAKAFESLYTQPPEWYTGTGTATAFNAGAFAGSLNTMMKTANQSMASSPGGSSGSGGGGSSGGGSGGGGGGGF